jgi:hypothetical protein
VDGIIDFVLLYPLDRIDLLPEMALEGNDLRGRWGKFMKIDGRNDMRRGNVNVV